CFCAPETALNGCSTDSTRSQGRAAASLRARYGARATLAAAWAGALKPGETLADAAVVPQLNPWFFGDDHLPGQKGGARRRLLDTAAYLHELQDRFYGRFVKAIRGAGYKRPVTGSPWQAPSQLPHYYNLASDYKAGNIDRHN